MHEIKLILINILQSILLKIQPSSKEKLTWEKSLSFRLTITLNFMLNSRRRFFARKIAKKSLNELSKERKKPQALILANGPSTKMLDFNKIVQLQRNNKLDVFVINSFFKFKVKRNFAADFLVLSDPTHKPNSGSDSTNELWQWIINQKNLKIICPTIWRSEFGNSMYDNLKVYYFNDFERLIPTKDLNPAKPRSYMSLTVLKALAVASSLGYKRIYLIGADNTMFKGLTGSPNNDIFQKSEHSIRNYHPPFNFTKIFGMTSSDYFADLSRIFASFSVFKHLNIINLDPNSLLDVFAKTKNGEFLKTSNFIDKSLRDH